MKKQPKQPQCQDVKQALVSALDILLGKEDNHEQQPKERK